MVLSSQQISEMNGAFQGQAMNQMAYSGMIGRPSAFDPGRMAGSTANAMGSIAGPAAAIGSAFLGLDPISMAFRGGSMGMRAAGMVGMGTGALAFGGGAAAVGMAAEWGAGQFMQGAQQHQQLGAQLRSSFGFRNQFGGTGFGNQETGMIGSSMRQMTTQMGPGGEMVNFEELSRLGANMGRMGMAQGVRNAKEFTEKFKEMVKTLKDIATEMGTSLEEAQKMMAGMKGSGIFGMGGAKQMAGMIRSGSQAGGLATSELTGMMSIGSQFSRMIGGRGSAGAVAGVKTLTTIGIAQQMGVLSESDIYEQTGEVGAMGRRALATQQMQSAAGFLKSNLGRHFVAAMAGRDGKLDEGDADEFAAGGIGTERTREMWQKNMSGVGRANYLRNEGRLRGEVLKRFGGLTQAVALSGWLKGKGVDLDTDNDRAMLFLQRNQNMGREEADNMMKLMRALPQIQREQKISDREEGMAQNLAMRQRTTGIEGIKHKLDHAVAEVKAKIQQGGANVMEGLTNEFERTVNYLTDTRIKEFRRDVEHALDVGSRGGAAGQAAMARTFGIGGGINANMQGLVKNAEGGGMGLVRVFNEKDRERFADAGYRTAGVDNAKRDQITALLRDSATFATAAGGAGTDLKLGADTRTHLRDLFSKVTGQGDDRVASIVKVLSGSGDATAKQLAKEIATTTDPGKKGELISNLNASLGIADQGRLFAVPDRMGVYNTSKYLTYSDQAEAIGKSLVTGHEAEDHLIPSVMAGAVGGTLAGGGVSTFVGAAIGLGIGIVRNASGDALFKSAGTYAKSQEGRDIAARALTSTGAEQRASIEDVQSQILKLTGKQAEEKGSFDIVSRGQLSFLKSVRAAQLLQGIGGTGASKAAKEKAATDADFKSVEEFMGAAAGVTNLVAADQYQARMQVEGKEARENLVNMTAGGLITNGELSTDLAEKYKVGSSGGDFLRAIIGKDQAMGAISEDVKDPKRKSLLAAVTTRGGIAQEKLDAMSVAEKRALAEQLRGKGATDVRALLLGGAATEERLRDPKNTRLTNMAKMLGINLDIDKGLQADIAALNKAKPGTDMKAAEEALAAKLSESIGLSSSSPDMVKAVRLLREGKVGAAGSSLSSVANSPEAMDARKKKSLDAAAAADPLQGKAVEHLDKIRESLGAQGAMTRALVVIAQNSDPGFKAVEKAPAANQSVQPGTT